MKELSDTFPKLSLGPPVGVSLDETQIILLSRPGGDFSQTLVSA